MGLPGSGCGRYACDVISSRVIAPASHTLSLHLHVAPSRLHVAGARRCDVEGQRRPRVHLLPRGRWQEVGTTTTRDGAAVGGPAAFPPTH